MSTARPILWSIYSPESDVRDRGEKLVEYEAAGVPEYWLIDHRRRQAYFYRLNAEAAYDLAPLDSDDIYRSAVLNGFWLRPDWLWQRPLPRYLRSLASSGSEDSLADFRK